MLQQKALASAHVGISIFEAGTNKYWYDHQSDKYFVPASNVKIATCYAALKHLGRRLPGIRYQQMENNTVIIDPTGDPTLLHPDFPEQPVFDFLRTQQHVLINTESWKEKSWGSGWSWDDYNEVYMAERSALPLYGNTVRFTQSTAAQAPDSTLAQRMRLSITPRLFADSISLYDVEPGTSFFQVERSLAANQFRLVPAQQIFTGQQLPFFHHGFQTTRKLLRDTLKNDVRTAYFELEQPRILFSQPTDSVLKPMMHRSDNFFAEQLLLMVSSAVLGEMNNEKIIDTLLQTALSDLPQKPRWVDGSGMSRYNLFSPRDFVVLLQKMRDEFGMEQLHKIFPANNQGTLKNYYVDDASFLYAKTGTLSGVVSLSGFLYTRKGKLLLFSVLVNNHQASAPEVRRAVEKFILHIRNKY